MSAQLQRVQWFPKVNPTGNPEDISEDILRLLVSRKKEMKTNQFKITLRNNPINKNGTLYGKYIDDVSGQIRFEDGDIIKIWIKKAESSSSFGDDDFVMTGVVKTPATGFGEETRLLEITGVDNSYVMLNKIWPKSYESQETPTTIIDIVRSLGAGSSGEVDPTDPTTYGIIVKTVTDGGFVEDTRKATAEDGSVNSDLTFPSRSITNYMKPAYTYIDALSSPEFTNTDNELDGTTPLVYSRNFMWYVDESNNFHWFYPDDGSDATLTVGEDDFVLSHNLKRTNLEAFNMVIWNAGEDENGQAITDYLFNRNTTETDLKIKYLPFTDIGNEYRDRLGQTGATLINSVTKDVEARINRMFAVGAKDAWRGTLNLRGNRYNVGDVLTLVDPQQGINNDFRVNGVTYNIDGNNLRTIYEIEEDQTKIISVL